MTQSPPWLLIVTGPPASGKSVLAERLAQDLHLPLLSKDAFKETLFDSLGYGGEEWSRRLSRAAYDLLFQGANALLRAHRECIIEANFDIDASLHAFERLQSEVQHRPLQLVCQANPETLVCRYAARQAGGKRHPGHHGDELIDPSGLLRRHGPLALAGPILIVDNESERSQGYPELLGNLSGIIADDCKKVRH